MAESQTALPELIRRLLQSHDADHPELLETHISWVILTGPYAYKIKKPVELNFVDFHTLARRRAACIDSSLESLMEMRKSSGFVRECHGDLHLRNLIRLNERIVAFDCLEFSAELRWIDTINEVAFLFMDLQAHGHPFLFDPLYYEHYYPYWRQARVELPTAEMLRFALPEGMLEEGGVLAGFLYFEPVDAEVSPVTFQADVVDIVSGKMIATLEIPFVVQQDE